MSQQATSPPAKPPDSRATDADIERLVAKRRKDEAVIKAIALVVIGLVVFAAIAFAAATAKGIDAFRTFVTQYFTWYLTTLATAALIYCLYMAFSRRGKIVLGGPNAKRDYGNFAWYSMLFAAGQGVGLVLWSVAEPILVKADNPVGSNIGGGQANNAGLIWTYFHWSLHAWAIYCVVALCLALSFHNRSAPRTFRDAVVMLVPAKARRGLGLFIEVIAIMATVFGLSTSFAFAAMQLTAGISATFGIAGTVTIRTIVIVGIGVFAAVSVFVGVDKGMKRISEANSVLSIVLLIGTLVFGPTLYIVSVVPETVGQYTSSLWWMGWWTDAANSSQSLGNWSDSWNGAWTVFIWAWCWAFSPFVGSFIASISRGRTVKEFVLGVLFMPTIICVVWIGIIGAAGLYYDDMTKGQVSDAVASDVTMGLFETMSLVPIGPIAFVLMLVATILVLTYYVTSLDSGVHALAGFVASASKPSKWFRTSLVVGIAAIAFLLLSLGGTEAVGTVQTGTILGAIPLSLVVIGMMVQAFRQTRNPRSPVNQERTEEEADDKELEFADFEMPLAEASAFDDSPHEDTDSPPGGK